MFNRIKRDQIRQPSQAMLCIALGIMALALLSMAIKSWHQDYQLSHDGTITRNVKKSIAFNNNEQIIDAIPKAHLFGQSMLSVGNMPITNLEMHLTGIVHGDKQSKAYIVIARDHGKIYSTGDKLPYGAKIYAITNDTVILQNEDRLEKLSLARPHLQFKARNTLEYN